MATKNKQNESIHLDSHREGVKYGNLLFRDASQKLRADIQFLRCIAVLSVVIFHIYPTRLTGGFIGVDIFFVISGYLMTLTITKGIDKVLEKFNEEKKKGLRVFGSSLLFLINFYARRIKRLAPAALALFAILLIALVKIDIYALTIKTIPQIIASALFYQNIFLMNNGLDYFGQNDAQTAVNHFWSLSVEEQFYMIWPLLLLIVFLLTYIMFKKKKVSKNVALAVVILFTLTSLIWSIKISNENETIAYFHTLSRIYELSAGGIIVFLPQIKFKSLILNVLPIISVLCLCAMFIFYSEDNFPGIKAPFVVILTMLVIYIGTHQNKTSMFQAFCRFRPFQFFGDISYSLYLYHMPLIVLIPVIMNLNLNNHSSHIKIMILILSIVFATVSYILIETPFKKIGNSKEKRK